MDQYNNIKNMILEEIDKTLEAVDKKQIQQMVDMISRAERVFVVGTGRVLLMLQAFVKRLNHLGIESYYVGEINEPAIAKRDILIAGSCSGESVLPVSMSKIAKKYKAKVVYIGSNPKSPVSKTADLFIKIPCKIKPGFQNQIQSQQPMNSLFEQSLLILCDIVIVMLARKKKVAAKDLWRRHANLK